MYRALIFDFDGVIADTKTLHLKAWRVFAEMYGKEVDHDFFIETFGKRNDEIIPLLLGETTLEKTNSLAEEKEAVFRDLAGGKISMIPGTRLLLGKISRYGLPIAVATSTPQSNMDFLRKALNLDAFFKNYVCGDNVAKGKPHPDIFLAAAAAVKVAPKDCVAFEDSFSGIEAAKAAGMYCVAVTTTRTKAELQSHQFADQILGDLSYFDLNLLS